MNKEEMEELLTELDVALTQAFPGPETISMLMVGGACLVLSEVIDRRTNDIDVVITDLLGTGEASLVYNLTPVTGKIRRIISAIGRRHQLPPKHRVFLNDDSAPFLLEQGRGHLPPARLFRVYQKLHLYIPDDLGYILACKFFAGRDKDRDDIAVLCQRLHIETREQAQALVNRFFPDPYQQYLHEVSRTLRKIFTTEE